jgi:hypothetical protein
VLSELLAPSNCYQVQVHVRVKIDETEEMLIGIVVRSVTSKKSCALDGSPSCERNARHMASRRWKTDLKFEIRWTLRS